jgi:hypothetical protein
VWVVLPFFADPRIHRFERYERLMNWDLRQHARGDFDGDGAEDLITFTGCAFISSVDVTEIPASEQCTATGIVGLVFSDDNEKIGQKYIQIDAHDLNLAEADLGLPISHSYLGKSAGENWKIFVNNSGTFQAFEIYTNGMLRKSDQVGMTHRLDEILYGVSRLFLVLVLPLVPLSLIFTPLFEPFRPVSTMTPIYEVITLACITASIYFFRKGSGRIKK